MKKRKLSKSLRKFIRREKSRIRLEVLDMKEQKRLIEELYEPFSPKKDSKNPTEKDK